jgi:hypothetical protein
MIVGGLALIALPREPQISVLMVDILVTANGYKAGDAIELITKPLEDILKAIDGVEHVYSLTQDDTVIATARFLVGADLGRHGSDPRPRKDPQQHSQPAGFIVRLPASSRATRSCSWILFAGSARKEPYCARRCSTPAPSASSRSF